MNDQTFLRMGRLALLLFTQIFFLNHIHIAGYITPLFIGYMLMCFPHGTSRIALLLWGFVTGVLFDTFSNTAGMGSAACTLLAMMQPSALKLLIPRDASEGFNPGLKSMGPGKYLVYALLCMLVLHTMFYLLDAFTMNNWLLTLASIGGSTLMATLLCLCAELFARRPKGA